MIQQNLFVLIFLFVLSVTSLCVSSCSNDTATQPIGQTEELFWVRDGDSEMPVILSGNKQSEMILLLIHGGPGGSSAEFLAGFEKNIGKDFLLASWDQRYSGFSKFEIPEQPLTMTVASNTEDCNTIVNFLKEKFPQKKIVIWGQSWGGAIVSSYASHPTYNNKIAGWIVVNGTVTGFEWHRSCWEFAVRRCKEVDSIQYKESLDWLRANPFEPSKPFDRAHLLKVIEIASGLYYEGEPEQTDAQLEEVVKRIKTFFPLAADMDRYSRNVALEVNDISTSAEMYTWRVNVSAMSAPGLLIWGEKDETCPIELLNWYSNLLTSNQKIHDVKIYSNAWHTPFYSDPEKHDADVKQFINGLQ